MTIAPVRTALQISTEDSYFARDGMLASVPLEHVVRIRIVLPELLDDVLTNVAVVLLDLASNAHLIFRRHGSHLPALARQARRDLRVEKAQRMLVSSSTTAGSK